MLLTRRGIKLLSFVTDSVIRRRKLHTSPCIQTKIIRLTYMNYFFRLHRQPKHLLAFLSAELGTVGAVDGNNQLIMKGRFQQKHIENVLRRYIKEYVTCHTCRSPETILNKETRLFFLQCMTCHSRCSVQTIKTGFQAVTGKRSVMRAKQ